MSKVSKSANVVQLFSDLSSGKKSKKLGKTGVSEKFSEAQYCVPKNEHYASLNFPIPDLPIGDLKKKYPGEWNSYRAMRYERCSKKGGYVLSPELSTFQKFLRAFGPKPDASYTLDRIDYNNPEYSPSNCRWASKPLQAVNKSNVRYLTDDTGVCLSASEWSKRTGIARTTILNRVDKLGWSQHEAVHGRNKSSHRIGRYRNPDKHPTMLKFCSVMKPFILKTPFSLQIQNKMYLQYCREYADDIQPDTYGSPDFDAILSAATGEFYRCLNQEYTNTRLALKSGFQLPDTPALDYLTGD